MSENGKKNNEIESEVYDEFRRSFVSIKNLRDPSYYR